MELNETLKVPHCEDPRRVQRLSENPRLENGYQTVACVMHARVGKSRRVNCLAENPSELGKRRNYGGA